MIIYRTVNKINGKSYIGIDSKNRSNYFGSGVAMKNALKKYGKDNFTKEIIQTCKTADELSIAEIKWIAFEKANNPNGIYNLHPGGLGNSGCVGKNANEIYGNKRALDIGRRISTTLKSKNIRPPSRRGLFNSLKQKESVKKMGKLNKSILHKNRIRDSQPHKIKILCVNDGKIFNSINEASESLNLSLGNVSQVVNGKRKHTKGYVFKKV